MKRHRTTILFVILLLVVALAIFEFNPREILTVLFIVAPILLFLSLSVWRFLILSGLTIKNSQLPLQQTDQAKPDTKKRVIEEAQNLPFLDAVFLICYYNGNKRRWGSTPDPSNIEAEDILLHFDKKKYDAALPCVRKLMGDGVLVGMAFFKYKNHNHSYDEQLAKFHSENPGFTEVSYKRASSAGIEEMR